MNLNRISASEAARLLNRRDLTAEQLARACLARIEQREPEVQAWTALRRTPCWPPRANSTVVRYAACCTACRWA